MSPPTKQYSDVTPPVSRTQDVALLVSRILLMLLFVLFGLQKLTHFSAASGYMATTGVPTPTLAAAIAVVMEFGVGLLIAAGAWVRPLSLVLAVYTLATAFIGHPYWTMTGMEQYMNMINFYKNISIVGGLILLASTGAGRYAVLRK
jgi:putative oxidoreductase